MFTGLKRVLSRLKAGAFNLIIGSDGSIYTEQDNGIRPDIRIPGCIDIQTRRNSKNNTVVYGYVDSYLDAYGAWSVSSGLIGSVILGAYNSVGTWGRAAVAIGNSNSVSEQSGQAGVAIGQSNKATAGSVAVGDTCVGGSFGFAAGSNCHTMTAAVAIGKSITAYYYNALFGCYLNCSGQFSRLAFGSDGTYGSMSGFIEGGIQTADATPALLAANAYSFYAIGNMVAKRAILFKGIVLAYSSAYKAKAWEISGLCVRDASNNTRIVGTSTIIELYADAEASTWAVTSITADDTNEKFDITVTGQANTSIRWNSNLTFTQTGH